MNDDSDVEAEAASADSFIWGEVVSLTELWIKVFFECSRFECPIGCVEI
jgi:hypothetical protein